MKTLISAVALATMLSTPALANKTPRMTECDIKQDVMLQQMIYEIDKMIMMLEEKRKALLQQYPEKPVDDEKAG